MHGTLPEFYGVKWPDSMSKRLDTTDLSRKCAQDSSSKSRVQNFGQRLMWSKNRMGGSWIEPLFVPHLSISLLSTYCTLKSVVLSTKPPTVITRGRRNTPPHSNCLSKRLDSQEKHGLLCKIISVQAFGQRVHGFVHNYKLNSILAFGAWAVHILLYKWFLYWSCTRVLSVGVKPVRQFYVSEGGKNL